MKNKLSLVFIWLFLSVYSSYGQCVAPIVMPDTLCVGEAFSPIVDDNLQNLQWRFCKQKNAFANISSAQNATVAEASGTFGMDLVKDSNDYFVFIVNRGANQLLRLEMGNGLMSPATSTTNLGNLGGLLGAPNGIRIIKNKGNWYGLITNGNGTILKISFGANLKNNTPSITSLGAPPGMSGLAGLRIVTERNNVYATVVAVNSRNMAIIRFKGSMESSVSAADIIVTPGFQGNPQLFGFDLIQQCNKWIAISSSFNGVINRITFNDSIFTIPAVEVLNSGVLASAFMFGIELVQEQDSYNAIVSTLGSGNYRLDFGNSINNAPTSSSITSFASINDMFFRVTEHKGAHYLVGTSANMNPSPLYQIRLGSECNAPSISTSSSPKPLVSYTQAGKYYVSLQAQNATGQNYYTVDSVVVRSVRVKFGSEYSCATKLYTFSDSSCFSSPVTYTWNLGDGSPEKTGEQISHLYAADGTYTVKLTIVDAQGNTDYRTQRVIFQNSEPVVNFSNTPLLCSGTQLQFTDQSVSPVDNIVEWHWSFGNGSISTLKNPVVTYQQPGQYEVQLMVKTANGCSASIAKTLNVAVGPAVKFGAERFCIQDAVHFSDSTTFPLGTQYLAGSRLWSFGDNTPTDTTKNPIHTYTATGTYQVTLTISNNTGCVSSITKTIRIYSLPTPNFSVPSLTFPNSVVPFSDSSTASFQNVVAWSWNFGEPSSGVNNTSQLQNPTHTFAQPDIYNVTLTVTTSQGCVASITKPVELLRDCPVTIINNLAPTIPVNAPIVVSANTTIGGSKFSWDFCAGDLRKTPVLEAQGAALTESYFLSPVVDGDSCYVFSSSMNEGAFANPWQRIRYGNSFSNAPMIGIPLGNPPIGTTPNALNRPICVRIFKKDTAFYGIAINFTTNTLVRLFFDSLTGNVSAQPLTVSPAPVRPENIEVVQDGDSLYAFITCNTLNGGTPSTANLLMRLSFGKSFANTPVVTLLNHPTIQQNNGGALNGMSFIKDCNTWYMTVVSNQGKIIRLNFGLSLNRTPTYFNATNEWLATLSEINNNQNNLVVKASMHRDMGKIYVFATTSAGVMARLSFDQLFLPPSSRRMIQNNGLGVFIRDIQFIKNKSEWHAFAINANNGGIFKWSFPNECATEVPIKTDETPLNVKYANGGSYYITLEASSERGWISSKLDSVVVSSPELQPIPIECPSLQVSMPTVACANQNITVSATANAASVVTWDMCAGDIDNALTFNSSVNFSNINDCRGLDIVQSGNSYFCLVANSLERPTILNFGNSLDNSFSASPIPLSGIPAPFYGASDIKAVQENGNWLVFLPFNSTPQMPNTPRQIVRMNYGASLTNTSPVFSNLSGGGLLSSPEGIALVEDNGQKYIFVVNAQGSKTIAVYQFGNSYFNTPKLSSFEVDSALSMKKIDFIKECNRWYALITDTDGNSVIRLDFHKGISQKPLFRKFFLGQDVRPWGIKLVAENGLFYALLTSSIDGQNKIRRIKFGNTMAANNITDAPSFDGLGVQVQSMLGFDVIKTPDSRIRMFGLAQYSSVLYKFSFMQNCSVNTPLATGTNHADIIYSQNGTYNVAATVTDTNGRSFTVTKPIVVRSPVRPDFDSSGVFCAGETVSFTNTSSLDPGIPITSVAYQWNFGDNNTAATANATHIYSNSGLYEVTLKSIAPGGCENTKKKTIRIYGKPTVDFSFPTPSIGLCANDSIVFNDTSTPAVFDQIVSRNWEVTDAQGTPLFVSQKLSPKFLFQQTGLYNVKLTVKGLGGCEVSLTKPVNITNLGAAVTITHSANYCLGESVQFTANVVNPVGTYTLAWDFGNNTTSDVENPLVTYSLPGTYQVTLRVTNQAGCVSNVSKEITIFNKPTAFANALDAICVNAPVTFDASGSSSEGNIISYSWNFGDGTPTVEGSQFVQAVHTYDTIGAYTVRLIIKTATGCSDTTESLASVQRSPIAAFSVGDTCVGSPLRIVNQSVANGIAGGMSYQWQFRNAANTADVSASTLANPTFTYTTAGTYTIILTTTANNGCPSILAKQVTIAGRPTARIAIDEGCIGAPFGFRDVSILPTPSDEVISRLWTISRNNGQGIAIRTEANPQLLFSAVGSYNVKLDIVTKNGCSASSGSVLVVVNPKPEADFTVATTAITTIPATLQFSNKSTTSANINNLRYLWDFGDGQTSIETNPTHTYNAEGIYNVRLITSPNSNTACADTVFKLVSVFVQINRGVELTNIAAVRSATNNISISLQVKNEGNIELTSLDLVAQLGDGLKVRERWTGSLPANATMEYPFKALFITRNQDVVPFVCAEALLVNPTQEITPDNNKLCKTLSNSFSLIAVRPNPADNVLNVSYLVTETADVSLEIIDILGKRVIVREMGSQTASIYDLSINTDELPEGMYYVRLNVGKDRIAQKLLISHP